MPYDQWSQVAIGSVCDGIFDGPHATPVKTVDGPVFLGIWNLVLCHT
jgi:type I restriction enzyme S subunit